MLYCKLENETLLPPLPLPEDYGSASNLNRASEEKLNQLGFYQYVPTPFKTEHQKIDRYQLQNGKAVPVLADYSDEIIWENVRNKRDALLTQCDWTQVSDSPVDRVAWAAYRQQLRDLPQTHNDPKQVVWPEKPIT